MISINRMGYDQMLVLTGGALLMLGTLALATATPSVASYDGAHAPWGLFGRQLTWLAGGLAVVFSLSYVSIHRLCQLAPWLLVAVSILLVVTGLFGVEVNGARRWLRFAGISVQPSELAKLAVVLYLAAYVGRHLGKGALSWGKVIHPLAFVGCVVVPTLLQPDFGTAALMATTAVLLLFAAGMRITHLTFLAASAGIAGWLLITSSAYRMERWQSYLNPELDPYGSAYQITQSLIAATRGNWFGQGLGQSVQKEYYLPEAHNDYIYAVVLEETGLVGGVLIVALFSLIVFRGAWLAVKGFRRSLPQHAILSLGIALCIGLQALMHIGASVNVLPPKGITLPLFSAGGSSLIVTLISLGLLLRASREIDEQEK